jgi:hypothetical protein
MMIFFGFGLALAAVFFRPTLGFDNLADAFAMAASPLLMPHYEYNRMFAAKYKLQM